MRLNKYRSKQISTVSYKRFIVSDLLYNFKPKYANLLLNGSFCWLESVQKWYIKGITLKYSLSIDDRRTV